MPENFQHYRDRCTRIEEKYQDLQDKYARLGDKDLEHSAENKQLLTENKQLKAENRDLGDRISIIEADKRIQNTDMVALKETISALAAKNIGIRRTKKQSREKSNGKSRTKHDRTSRKKPDRIDERRTIDDHSCKNCGSDLSESYNEYKRIVEEIIMKTIVTEYTIQKIL